MLTRRRFLTGLGLGGVVVATPPVARAFLDVGKATREGEARFGLKTPRTLVPVKNVLWGDTVNPPYGAEEGYEGDWWKVDAKHREGLRISYRDTYIDQLNGDIWTVNPETNIATKTASGTKRAHLTSSLLKATV